MHLGGATALGRQLAARQLAQQDAEAVHVAGRGGVSGWRGQFGCNVGQKASRARLERATDRGTQAEVEQPNRSARGDEHVARTESAVNEGRLLRMSSLQPARDLGADVGHLAMPAAGRLVLASGQHARFACVLEELAQVRAFHEGRNSKDQPVARVCLHDLGDMGIGKGCAALGCLQERLADRARDFQSFEPQHLHCEAAVEPGQALDASTVGFEAAASADLLGTLVAAQLLEARWITRCRRSDGLAASILISVESCALWNGVLRSWLAKEQANSDRVILYDRRRLGRNLTCAAGHH